MQVSNPAHVRLDVLGRAATITIDRPPLNVLDLKTLAELAAAVEQAAAREELQVVFVRGGGERAFSAGVAVEDHTREKIPRMLESFHGALRRLWSVDALTVAVVHGHCLGGGMELAAACDLVVASDDSRFGQPEIRLGCFPPVAAALYPALVGKGAAYELLLTGESLDCAAAERLGFVTRRVSRTELDAEIARLTAHLGELSTAVLRLTKKAIRAGLTAGFEAALAAAERIYIEELLATADVEEGVEAFLERRPPVWRHR